MTVDFADAAARSVWEKSVTLEIRPKDALLDPDAGLLSDYGVVKEVEELKTGGKQITMSFGYQDESRGKTAGQQLIGDASERAPGAFRRVVDRAADIL